MSTLRSEIIPRPLAEAIFTGTGDSNAVHLFWLGQAGFSLRYGAILLVIDPYLSDYLAHKYKDAEFKHQRMMPPPLSPEEAAGANWVLATHKHSDHLDPWTVTDMLGANPDLKIVVPAAALSHARDMGIPQDRLMAMDAGQTKALGSAITIHAVPAAHETLATDSEGRQLYLGYIIGCGALAIYHSGDCVPFRGLAETLAALDIDLALLPINGRDAYRRKRNVPGNFTVQEAVNLCESAGIANMIGHHFGMFDFNTTDPLEAGETIRASAHLEYGCCAELNRRYILSAD